MILQIVLAWIGREIVFIKLLLEIFLFSDACWYIPCRNNESSLVLSSALNPTCPTNYCAQITNIAEGSAADIDIGQWQQSINCPVPNPVVPPAGTPLGTTPGTPGIPSGPAPGTNGSGTNPSPAPTTTSKSFFSQYWWIFAIVGVLTSNCCYYWIFC